MGYFSDIIEGETPVLVDFFAEWCQPCKIMKPILVQLKAIVGDKVTILKIDIDKNREVAQKYHIQSVPTLIIFKKGEIVWRQSGVMQARELEQILNPFLLPDENK